MIRLATEAEFHACFGALSNHIDDLNSRIQSFAFFRKSLENERSTALPVLLLLESSTGKIEIILCLAEVKALLCVCFGDFESMIFDFLVWLYIQIIPLTYT